MKMVRLVCNINVLREVIGVLQQNHVAEYEVVREVTGKGVKGDPRLNTPVWPGLNSTVMIPFRENEKADAVVRKIREFNRNGHNDNENIICCSWSMDEYFWD